MSSAANNEEALDSKKSRRRKLSHGLDFSDKEKIWKLYRNKMDKMPSTTIEEIEVMVAQESNISVEIVKEIRKEFTMNGCFKNMVEVKKVQHTINLQQKNDIRANVHKRYLNGEIPVLRQIWTDLNNDPTFPIIKIENVNKLVHALHFNVRKFNNKKVLIDTDEIIIWRRNYLRKIREYRKEGRKIYYVIADYFPPTIISKRIQEKPSENTKLRYLLCHLGGEDGFVIDPLSVIEGPDSLTKTKRNFEDWFTKVLPLLPKNTVVVLDNSYFFQCRYLEEFPVLRATKREIQKWLSSKNIPFDNDMVRAELLKIVHGVEGHYATDEIAKKENISVLRIPAYHSELNPLDSVWQGIKYKDTNKLFSDEYSLFEHLFNEFPKDELKNFFQHVEEIVETQLWAVDDIMDKVYERPIDPIDTIMEEESEDFHYVEFEDVVN